MLVHLPMPSIFTDDNGHKGHLSLISSQIQAEKGQSLQYM